MDIKIAREVAARIWQDQEMSHVTMNTNVAEEIAQILYDKVDDPKTEMLNEILGWVKKKTNPDQNRACSRCVICNATWWDNKDHHMWYCWVPDLENLLSRRG